MSSAVIRLNAAEVVSPAAFNQQMGCLTVPVPLTEENRIEIELRSEPGSSLLVSVTQSIQADGAAIIGPAGGVARVEDRSSPLLGVEAEIPPGTFSDPSIVLIRKVAVAPSIDLPPGANLTLPLLELEATGSPAQPVLLRVPFESERDPNVMRALLYLDEHVREWAPVAPLPSDDPAILQAPLDHFSIYAAAQFTEARDRITTTFTMASDSHNFENLRPGCVFDSGYVEDNGICAGMSLLAEEYFKNHRTMAGEGLRCRWTADTDFSASCDAQGRFSEGSGRWTDKVRPYLYRIVQLASVVDLSDEIDYLKLSLRLNQPETVALFKWGNPWEKQELHAVVVVGWERVNALESRLQIYDVNHNDTLRTINIATLGPFASMYYAADFREYDGLFPVARIGLDLGGIIDQYPSEHLCGGPGPTSGPRNRSFEVANASGTTPLGWTPRGVLQATHTWKTGDAHAGLRSVCIGMIQGDSSPEWVSDFFPVKPETSYRVGAWAKGSGQLEANAGLYFRDAQGEWLTGLVGRIDANAAAWSYSEATVQAWPNAATALFVLGTNNPGPFASDEVCFDDVVFEEVQVPPARSVQVVDSCGDVTRGSDPGFSVGPPDLATVGASIAGGTLTLQASVCQNNAIDDADLLQFYLDTNNSGIQIDTSNGDTSGNSALAEFLVVLPTYIPGAVPRVHRLYTGIPYDVVGYASVSRRSDGWDISLPLSLLDTYDGRMAFKVRTSHVRGAGVFWDLAPSQWDPAATIP